MGLTLEPDKEQLVEDISKAMQRMAHMFHFVPGVWMDLDLTIVQLKSLLYIDFKGSTNFKQLADALGVTPPSVTGIIDRLVEQGLISREENPTNRRMQVLRTTDRGKSLIQRLLESRRSTMSTFLGGLSMQDLSSLARITSILASSIEQNKQQMEEDNP
jgi:DNA-binding MarR family transcriptional regulator